MQNINKNSQVFLEVRVVRKSPEDFDSRDSRLDVFASHAGIYILKGLIVTTPATKAEGKA